MVPGPLGSYGPVPLGPLLLNSGSTKGGMGEGAFAPRGGSAPPPQSEGKMAKNSHFRQIFGFLPPQTHIFSPSMPPPPHKQISGAATAEYSKLNMLQDHIWKRKAYCSRSISTAWSTKVLSPFYPFWEKTHLKTRNSVQGNGGSQIQMQFSLSKNNVGINRLGVPTRECPNVS